MPPVRAWSLSMAFGRGNFPSRRICPAAFVSPAWRNSSSKTTPLLSEQLGRHANYRRQAFVALNTAFMGDGAVVIVPPGCCLAQPIYLIYVSSPGAGPLVSHPRTLIFLGAGSEAKIIESYVGVDEGAYFCNAVTELIGAADSLADYYRLQREGRAAFHTGTFDADLDRGAHLTAHAVTLGGSLVRNNVHVALNGEGAECVLNGLYLGRR